MCLSESIFLSLSLHFQKNISALGYPRFFKFFQEYFQTIYSIESAKWLYLFSDYPSETTWRKIVFIGKDRNGDLRRRWQAFSEEELIFIDMYPDTAFGSVSEGFRVESSELEISQLKTQHSTLNTVLHIEDYQLMQLEKYGIRPEKKEIVPRLRNRVILYPEVGVTKSKWYYENFVELYHALHVRGVEVYIIESFGLNLTIMDKISIEDLADVQTFFEDGGIFVSNDSGMAHFASIHGLYTITIFSDFDPVIWHPRGEHVSLRLGIDHVDVPTLEALIMQLIPP